MKKVVAISAALLFPLTFMVGAAQAATFEEITIPGGPVSISDATPIQIDAAIFVPEVTPAPAVVLAHGFGGSKLGLTDQAEKLRAAGYVVVTYSARGFGKTIAQISMNSPAFEIADAQAIITFLGTRTEVIQEGADDPRVGFAGGSYGGALSLMVAGYDNRVDAVAADITWNNLEQTLFPQGATNSFSPGIFKQLWTGFFFSVGMATPPNMINQCGRFTLEWCAAYQEAFLQGQPSAASQALMFASSPASVASQITAPTLLLQGQSDSLFPLSEADATYNQIKSANPETPVKMVWHGGGHDGGLDESDRIENLTLAWFEDHLAERKSAGTDFEITLRSGSVISNNSDQQFEIFSRPEYPGLNGSSTEAITVGEAGVGQQIIRPAGGVPANITVLPGVSGGLSSLVNRPLPNQSAVFDSAVLENSYFISGSSSVSLQVSAVEVVPEATLFVSLRIVGDGQRETLPNGLVTPVRVFNVGPDPQTVEVELPTIVQEVNPGEKLRIVVTTTDFGYRMPLVGAQYEVALADNTMQLATANNFTNLNAQLPPLVWIAGALLMALLIGIGSWLIRPRNKAAVREDLLDVPVRIENLAKEFKGGLRAVNDITWEVPAGKVIGLLGPNGAGKTTTMRMIMGLIRPTEGEIFVYGNKVAAGSPVLSQIGSLVEGAGFLPHLTGRENLDLYWKASGRSTEDPHLDAVLAIADLGTALDRKVRTYSQGMRQRLGISQAMLGMPKLLMLDEPTNGLDPPQIRAMREMLMSYADTGRTVIVSSHLLSEVEQTCSHVIVMHRGQLVTTGRVDELLEGKSHLRLEDFFLEVVGDDLTIGKQA